MIHQTFEIFKVSQNSNLNEKQNIMSLTVFNNSVAASVFVNDVFEVKAGEERAILSAQNFPVSSPVKLTFNTKKEENNVVVSLTRIQNNCN